MTFLFVAIHMWALSWGVLFLKEMIKQYYKLRIRGTLTSNKQVMGFTPAGYTPYGVSLRDFLRSPLRAKRNTIPVTTSFSLIDNVK